MWCLENHSGIRASPYTSPSEGLQTKIVESNNFIVKLLYSTRYPRLVITGYEKEKKLATKVKLHVIFRKMGMKFTARIPLI